MGRRKRKSAPKSSLCSVCQSTYQLSTSSILPCSLHIVSSPHTICDLCLYRHIFTVLSKDVTSSVICPIQGCDDVIPNDIIQPILLKFNINLSEEYTLKFNWRGTSEQWIKRFTARCPGCSVPIEKNGGCNQVVCQRCRQVFDWQRAKNSNLYRMQTRYRTLTSPVMAFFCRLFIVALVILLVVLCLIYTEKLLLIGDSLLRNLFGSGGGGFPQQFSGPFPQQGFGQFGSGGGFFNGGSAFPGGNAYSGGAPFPGGSAFSGGSPFPGGNAFSGGSPFPSGNAFSGGSQFQGGIPFSGGSPFAGSNAFPGGASFPSPLPSSGFPSAPIGGGQFGQGFGFPGGSGGFGYQPPPFLPGQQTPFGNQNYFGSGSYGRPRSRRSSRRRGSKSRRRRTSSSSSSSDEGPRRGSPFVGPGNPYVNLQPFPNMPPVSPRVGSPLIPQRPVW